MCPMVSFVDGLRARVCLCGCMFGLLMIRMRVCVRSFVCALDWLCDCVWLSVRLIVCLVV